MADASAAASTIDGAEAFEMAYLAEMSNLHVILQEEPSNDTGTRLLRHLASLRKMVADSPADAATLRGELHDACVAKARDWVEQRLQHLVAEFHLRWHEESDLLAVDRALRQGSQLVSDAEGEVGALPVSHEVFGACEQQLCARLALHVRRANRHELRMIYPDFCGWASRAELRQLCLDKYREQVDKHVQTEAVATQVQLQGIIDARDASKALTNYADAVRGAGGDSGGGAGGGSAGSGATSGGGHGCPVGVSNEGLVSTVMVLHDYLEGVAGLGEELTESELPAGASAAPHAPAGPRECTPCCAWRTVPLPSRSPPPVRVRHPSALTEVRSAPALVGVAVVARICGARAVRGGAGSVQPDARAPHAGAPRRQPLARIHTILEPACSPWA